MIEGKELLEFATEMIKVLNEKTEKYKGDWETTHVNTLLKCIEDQLEKLKDPILNDGIPYRKRRLLHIANFCFLLYNKLIEYDVS